MAKIDYAPVWSNTLVNEYNSTGALTKARNGWLQKGDVVRPITHKNYNASLPINYFGTAFEPWATAYLRQFGKSKFNQFNPLNWLGLVYEITDETYSLVLIPPAQEEGTVEATCEWRDDGNDVVIPNGGNMELDKGQNNSTISAHVNVTLEEAPGFQPYVLMAYLPDNDVPMRSYFCPPFVDVMDSGIPGQSFVDAVDGIGAYGGFNLHYDDSSGYGLRQNAGGGIFNDSGTAGGWDEGGSQMYMAEDAWDGQNGTNAWSVACGWGDGSIPTPLGYVLQTENLSSAPGTWNLDHTTLEGYGDHSQTEGMMDYKDGDGIYDPSGNFSAHGTYIVCFVKRIEGSYLEGYDENVVETLPTGNMFGIIGDAPIFTLRVGLQPYGYVEGTTWGNVTPNIKYQGETIFAGTAEEGHATSVTDTQDIVLDSSVFTAQGSSIPDQLPNMPFWRTLVPGITEITVVEQYFIDGEVTFSGNIPDVTVESDKLHVDEQTVGIRIMNPIHSVAPTLTHVQGSGAEMTVTFNVDATGDYWVYLISDTLLQDGSNLMGGTNKYTASATGAQSTIVSDTDISALNLTDGNDYYVKIISDGDNNKWARGNYFAIVQSMTGLELVAPSEGTQFKQGETVTVSWKTVSNLDAEDDSPA